MRVITAIGLLCAVVAVLATHRTKISNNEWLNEATGNNRWRIAEDSFKAQREYRFVYNGQIATGIPQTSEQHVATRIQAVVSLIMKTDTTVVLKLTHIRMGYEHRDIAEPREMLPFEVYEETPIDVEFDKLLKMPVTFKYTNGMITDLTFDGEEKPWTANIKRGVLNMLQVNLKQHARTDMAEEQLLLNGGQEPVNKYNDFFAVQEKTLEGDCEVFYTVTKQPHEKWTKTQSILNVTKSINFEKCRTRPDIRYNMRFGEECESCERKYNTVERNMDSSTVFEYNITGTIEQFLIESVRVKSQYIFAPLNEQSNVITTYVTQTLKLLHAGSIETRVELPTNAKLSESQLVYTQEWDEQKERFFMDGDREFLKDTPYTEVRDKVKLMEPLVQRLLTAMSDDKQGVEQEATRQLARIVKVLRMCDRAEIEKIHQAFYDQQTSEKFTTEQHEKVKDILVDALALAGTKTTIEHLVEKIKLRKVHPVKAAIALKALINTRVVSEKQIELVMGLCKDTVCERNPFLKQSCYLTVGSMINALCKTNDDQLAMEQTSHHLTQKVLTKFCPIQLKQKYVREFMSMYESATTQYEKVLYLKTLANAGIDLTVFDLEKIIKNTLEVPMIRSQAIDALRLLRSVMPRKIQKMLMPVFKNKYELPEIRMVAVAQIMQTLPERPIIDQITEQLFLERSQQVHTFVYTMLDTLANSTNPCEKRCAEDIQVSLRRARMLYKTIPKSQYRHFRFYDEDLDLGASLNLGVIFGNDSFIPKEAMVNLGTLVRGEWNKFVAQIGFIQQNTENLIEKLLGHQGLLVDKSFEQLITRGRRALADQQPSGYLRSLFQKLGVRGRRQRDQQPSAMLYIRYKDQDYGMLPIDYETFPESIKSAISDDRLNLQFIERFFAQGYRFNYQTAGFIHESQRKIPTTLGLPLVLSGKIPTVASINGQIKIQMDPTTSNRLSGGKMQIHARPSIATTMICKMEVWSPIVNAGLKIVQSMQLNVPFKFELEMNTDRKPMELKWTVTMPQEKTRLVTVQSRPITFVRTWPKSLTTYAEPQEKTVYGEQWDRVNTFDKKIGENTIGVLFHLHGQWHRTPSDSLTGTPLAPFAGNNQLQITMEPGYMPPKEYIIRFEADTFGISDTVERPEFDTFYGTKDVKDFFLDDSSSSEESSNSKTQSNSASGEQSVEQNTQSYMRYAKSYVPKNMYKHRMMVKIESVGSTIQRKSQMEIRTQFDEETRFCKLSIDMTRNPIPFGKYRETRPWTLKAKMQTLYPKMPFTLIELKQESDDQRQFTAQLEAEWGSEQQHSINLKVQGERSMWQKRRQSKYIAEVEQRRDSISSIQQYEQLMRVSMLDQYKVHVSYNLPTFFRNYTNKVYRFLKYVNYEETKVNEIGVNNPENRLQMQVNIDPRTLQYVNVTIETPRENTQMIDVLLPFAIRPINIRRSYGSVRSMKDLIFTSIASTVGMPKCVVSTDRVRTFDKVKYNVPLTTCYSVLAKDCSGYDQPAFVVLMKKLDQTREHKKIKIVTQEKQIEMWLEHNGQFKIRVNGKSVPTTEIEQHEIHQEGETTFVVQLPTIGVRVTFDGYAAQIQMSHMYKNAQCGLCGHYNDEKTDVFRTASNELVDDLTTFHRSYLQTEDSECQVDETIVADKKRYRYDSKSWETNSDSNSQSGSSSSESNSKSKSTSTSTSTSTEEDTRSSTSRSSEVVDNRKPRLATKVIEYNHELCFSTKPIFECPTNTYPVEHQPESKKVSFGCLPRTDPHAVRLERQVMRHQIVDINNVEGVQLKPSFVESVFVPIKCRRL